MFDQLVGLLLVGLGLRNPVSGSVAGETTEVVETQESPVGENRLEIRTGRKELRREVRDDRKDTRASHVADIKERRETFHEELKIKREEAKEVFAEKREAFKGKLKAIGDERKQAVVERLDIRMNEVNEHRTSKMSEHLDKMSEILEKLIARAAEAEANGEDTSGVDSAVSSAQSAISAAQTAVTAQAGKDYVVTISTETGLGSDVRSMMNTLQSDLKGVHAQVVTARQAVSAAIRAL